MLGIPQMIVGSLFYLIHYLLKLFVYKYNFTMIRNYFADYLTLIVCVPIFVNIQLLCGIKRKKYITIFDIILFFLIFSIYGEIILPKYNKDITGDYFDIIAYGIGGIVLYISTKVKCKQVFTAHNKQ
jgi:predicted neutral ceramidase superfamily lipid hydrolase